MANGFLGAGTSCAGLLEAVLQQRDTENGRRPEKTRWDGMKARHSSSAVLCVDKRRLCLATCEQRLAEAQRPLSVRAPRAQLMVVNSCDVEKIGL